MKFAYIKLKIEQHSAIFACLVYTETQMPNIHRKIIATSVALIASSVFSATSQASVTRFAFKGEIEGGLIQAPNQWPGAIGVPVSGWVEIDTANLNNASAHSAGGCSVLGGACLEPVGSSFAPVVSDFVLRIGDLSFLSFTNRFSTYNYFSSSDVYGQTSANGSIYETIGASSYSFQTSFDSVAGNKRVREQHLKLGGHLTQLHPDSDAYSFTPGFLGFWEVLEESWGCITADNCAQSGFNSWTDDSGKYYSGYVEAAASLSEFYVIPEPNAAVLAVIGLGGVAISRRRLK